MLANLVANLGLEAADFFSGAQGVSQAWDNLSAKLTDGMKDFNLSLAQGIRSWQDFSGTLIQGGAALSAAVSLPILGLGTSALKMASDLQAAEISFTTMLGSAQKAGDFLNQLKDFAAKTPFEFSDLVVSAKRMMALGFAADQVIPSLTAIGNAAAGLGGGAELINRLTLALGQMQAKGKVSAEEMRQLAEAGVPAWKILADAIGKSIPEAMKLAENGAISSAQAIPALMAGMTQKFDGLMDSFSKTAMGQFSNLKDQIGFILADIGKAILPLANTILQEFLIPLATHVKDAVAWFAQLPEPVKETVIVILGLVAAIGPLIAGIGALSFGLQAVAAVLAPEALGAAVGTIAAALGSMLPIVLGVAAAVAAGWAAWQLWNLEPVQSAVKELWSTLQDFWNNTLSPFIDVVMAVGKAFVDTAAEILSSGLSAAWTVLSDLALDLWKNIKDLWENGLVPLGAAFKELWDALGPLQEPLKAIAMAMLEILGALIAAGLVNAIQQFAFEVKAAVTVIKLIVDALTGALTFAMQEMTKQFNTAASAIETYFVPIWKAATNAVTGFFDMLRSIPGVGKLFDDAFGGINSKIEENIKANQEAAKATDTTTKAVTESGKAAGTATQFHIDLGGSQKDAKKFADELAKATGLLSDNQYTLVDALKKTDAPTKSLATAQKNLVKTTDELNRAANDFDDAFHSLATKTLPGAKTSTEDLRKAEERLKDAKQDLTRAATDQKKAEDDVTRIQKEEQKAADDLAKSLDKLLHFTDDLKVSDGGLAESLKDLHLQDHTLLVDTLGNAFKDLGIKHGAAMIKMRDEAKANYEAIRDSALTTSEDKRRALFAELKLEADAYATPLDAARAAYTKINESAYTSFEDKRKALATSLELELQSYTDQGKAVPAQLQIQLAQMEQMQKDHKTNTVLIWKEIWTDIHNGFTTMFEDVNKALLSGNWSGIKDGLLKGIEGIGQSIADVLLKDLETRLFKPLEDKITDWLTNQLMGLFNKIPGLGGGGGSLFDLAGLFGGGGGGVVSPTSIGGVPIATAIGQGLKDAPWSEIFTPVTDAAKSTAESVGSVAPAMTGAASSIASSTMSMVTGIAGAVGSIAGAVGSIYSNFQLDNIKQTLNYMHNDVAYMAWRGSVGGEHDAVLATANLLNVIFPTLMEARDRLNDILAALTSGGSAVVGTTGRAAVAVMTESDVVPSLLSNINDILSRVLGNLQDSVVGSQLESLISVGSNINDILFRVLGNLQDTDIAGRLDKLISVSTSINDILFRVLGNLQQGTGVSGGGGNAPSSDWTTQTLDEIVQHTDQINELRDNQTVSAMEYFSVVQLQALDAINTILGHIYESGRDAAHLLGGISDGIASLAAGFRSPVVGGDSTLTALREPLDALRNVVASGFDELIKHIGGGVGLSVAQQINVPILTGDPVSLAVRNQVAIGSASIKELADAIAASMAPMSFEDIQGYAQHLDQLEGDQLPKNFTVMQNIAVLLQNLVNFGYEKLSRLVVSADAMTGLMAGGVALQQTMVTDLNMLVALADRQSISLDRLANLQLEENRAGFRGDIIVQGNMVTDDANFNALYDRISAKLRLDGVGV